MFCVQRSVFRLSLGQLRGSCPPVYDTKQAIDGRHSLKKLPIIGLIVGAIAMLAMRRRKGRDQTEDSGSA